MPFSRFTFHSEKGTERRDLPRLVAQATCKIFHRTEMAFLSELSLKFPCQGLAGMESLSAFGPDSFAPQYAIEMESHSRTGHV